MPKRKQDFILKDSIDSTGRKRTATVMRNPKRNEKGQLSAQTNVGIGDYHDGSKGIKRIHGDYKDSKEAAKKQMGKKNVVADEGTLSHAERYRALAAAFSVT